MYSSRRDLYRSQNYYLAYFIIALLRCYAAPVRQKRLLLTRNCERSCWFRALLVLCFLSLPLCFSLFRNYQCERSQPPMTIVPDLIGLPLTTGIQKSHSVHLETEVLGRTWYTNLSPGRITLQSPEAGQCVPFGTTVGVELAIIPPAFAP